MKNEVKKNWQQYFKIVLVLLIPIVSGSTNPPITESPCPEPQVTVTSQSGGSASFAWNAVNGAPEYVVFCIKQGDNYPNREVCTRNTSITLSGLPSGTYDFYFATVCGTELSEFIIVEDLVL